jgi:isoquinoline 1-oxidoreductase beta subunit
LASAAKRIEVEYELPYLAHACMEPMNCTAHVTPAGCEIWVGTQSQTQDAQMAAEVLDIDPKKVILHTQFLGGGFGRRASGDSDFTVEAVHVANGMGRPVKTLWTREDDMRAGYYRPFSLSRIRAGIDAQGVPLVIHHTVVNKSVLAGSRLVRDAVKDGVDRSTVDGAADIPYAIPNHRVELHSTTEAVPILWWRSVGNSINGFVTNTLIDELAVLGHKDPVALRRMLLADKPRHLAVLEQAVSQSGYGKINLPHGHYHGVALHESFGSIVAQVAEVSVSGSDVRVHRVTCAIDCGLAVNPDQIVAQMQSAIIFGLSAALRGEITIAAGKAQQSNFNDYPVVRMNEAPAIDVHIIASDEKPGGVGEPGTPPIAPAVCNGIFAATGKRIRRLPISASLGASRA